MQIISDEMLQQDAKEAGAEIKDLRLYRRAYNKMGWTVLGIAITYGIIGYVIGHLL